MAIEKISAGVSDYSAMTTSTNASVRSKEASNVVTEPRVRTVSESSARVSEGVENETAQLQMDAEKVKKKISEINRQLNNNTECHYGIHEETQRVTLKIVDKETQEVLKEFPAEKTLEMIAKVWELAGILVDERR